MSISEAQLFEVFNSFQGEGVFVGERQTFVRFSGCNLSCSYCDTLASQEIVKEYKVENIPGKKDTKLVSNPVTSEQLIELIHSFDKPKNINHSVCLTGGEPLLQAGFIKPFLEKYKQEIMIPIYLESNGTLPDHLSEVIDLVDIIAMDLKLSSATGLSNYWKEHKKFLEIAYMKQVFVKLVFTKETLISEIDQAAELIAAIDVNIPLVLQPVSPHGPVKHRPSTEQMFAFFNIAKRKLAKVRLIPQAHKLLSLS